MDWATQAVTIAAVLLGAMASTLTSHLAETRRHKQELQTRWDAPKLDAYVEYVAAVRSCIYAAVLLFEVKDGRRSLDRTVEDLTLELVEAEGRRALTFERVMLLAGSRVIDAAHRVNRATAAVDWRSRGATAGELQEWRQLNRAAFAAINEFHQVAREDLGVIGRLDGTDHSHIELNLPTES